jgi:hypothetical protein
MEQGRSTHQQGQDGSRFSLLTDVLRSTTRFVSRNPKATLWSVAVVTMAAIASTILFIEFKTDRADLIDPEAAFHQRWLDYTESFGDASDLVVVVEAKDTETIKATLDDLGERLSAEPTLFRHVLYKVQPDGLRRKGLQYLTPEQLEAGLNRLQEYRPILEGRWDLVSLDSLFQRFRTQLQDRTRNRSAEQDIALLSHADSLTKSLSVFLADGNDFRSPWPALVSGGEQQGDKGEQAVYLLDDSGTMGFLKVFPAESETGFDGASAAIDRLRGMMAEVSRTHSGTRIGLTGIPVLESDEMNRSQHDMLTASVISFVGVGLLLCLGFRGVRHPLLALIMLAVGMAWAFGYTTLAIGHLNILSVSFAVILIGLGIDFAIHFMARYLELRHAGHELRPALTKTSTGVGTGIVTAAVTTSMAFFCATFTQFLGVAELGIIAGGGILLCAAATFVVLPALISLADRGVEPSRLPTPIAGDRLRTMTSRYPIPTLALSVVAVAVVASQCAEFKSGELQSKVAYDSNLLHLQADGLASVEVQKRIFHKSGTSLLFAVSLTDSPEEARKLKRQFEALPSVGRVEELASRLPAHPPEETQLMVQAFRARLAGLAKHRPRPTTTDPADVGRSLEQFFLQLRVSNSSTAARIASRIDRFLDTFERFSLRDQLAFLRAYEARMQFALWSQFESLGRASDTSPPQLSDLPDALTTRFVGPKGRWLLQVYPSQQVWDIEPLARFVDEVRSVDPEATGTPLQNFEAARQIRDSYEKAAAFALAVICLVLLVDFLGRDHKLIALLIPAAVVGFLAITLHARRTEVDPVFLVVAYATMAAAIAAMLDFRSLRDALFAMLPPVGGGLMMFGVLGYLGVNLNPANLIVLPLVLGIGVDDGVHVVHDFRMQTGRYRTSASTINAIVLTSLTSIIGFGSMMVAAHRGLYSVGLVLVVGVGCCLFVSLVMLPAILTLVASEPGHHVEAKDDANTLATDAKSVRKRAA